MPRTGVLLAIAAQTGVERLDGGPRPAAHLPCTGKYEERDDADVTSARQLAVIVGALFVLLMGAYVGVTGELRAAPLAFGALTILFVGSRD